MSHEGRLSLRRKPYEDKVNQLQRASESVRLLGGSNQPDHFGLMGGEKKANCTESNVSLAVSEFLLALVSILLHSIPYVEAVLHSSPLLGFKCCQLSGVEKVPLLAARAAWLHERYRD